MIDGKKIVVVMPAYNAEKTLEDTYNEIPFDIVDEVIIVDDASRDKTVDVAKKLGIKHIIVHEKNILTMKVIEDSKEDKIHIQ